MTFDIDPLQIFECLAKKVLAMSWNVDNEEMRMPWLGNAHLRVRASQLLWPNYEVDHIQVLSDLVFTWNVDNKVKRMINLEILIWKWEPLKYHGQWHMRLIISKCLSVLLRKYWYWHGMWTTMRKECLTWVGGDKVAVRVTAAPQYQNLHFAPRSPTQF